MPEQLLENSITFLMSYGPILGQAYVGGIVFTNTGSSFIWFQCNHRSNYFLFSFCYILISSTIRSTRKAYVIAYASDYALKINIL